MPTPDFPAALAFHGRLTVTPRYRTLKTIYESGQEQRVGVRMNPLYTIEIDYAPLLMPPLDDALIAHWHRALGDLYGFYFQDWSMVDKTSGAYLRAAQVVGVGNGERLLFKTHEDRLTAATIYVDDVEQMAGVSVELATGLVTFDVAPALDEVVTADVEGGAFLVRYEGDELPMQRVRPRYWHAPIIMQQVGSFDPTPVVE